MIHMTKCYLCEKGVLQVREVPYSVYGEPVGKFKGEICEACGETFFDEETSLKITEATKAKGLFGMGAKTKIGQAGTTLDIRLPKKIIDFLHLTKGKEVTIYPETKKRLVIEL